MHSPTTLGSFFAMRANGWSLSKISKELNVAKSTLWKWDNEHQNAIHVLRHYQLEKLQEKYLPTYEDELGRLRAYLDRLEQALAEQDFSKMGPEFLLQMSLQIRSRLGKMREQVPLRPLPCNQPVEPLPITGCISAESPTDLRADYAHGYDLTSRAADFTPPQSRNGHTDHEHETEPPPNSNGHSHDHPASDLRGNSCNSCNQNRTKVNETTPPSKNGTLIINHLQNGERNGRSIPSPNS